MPTNLTAHMGAPSQINVTAPTAQTDVGAKFPSEDGRAFRYVKAGAADLQVGKTVQAPAQIANHQNLTPSAAAKGATSITVTLGATAMTENFYTDGWAVITTSAGAAYQYRISSNPAASASASVTIRLDDPIEVALTGSSRVDLIPNPYNGVILSPAALTSAVVGVAVFPIPAGQFGYVQVQGVASVLADGAITAGTSLAASNATAGAVEPAAGVQPVVGHAVTDIATTEYGAVMLNLP